jgi:hypothetical protein
MADRHFCRKHGIPRGPHPSQVFGAPEVGMPPDLVAEIRRICPRFVFPKPEPATPAPGELASSSPALLPPAVEGEDGSPDVEVVSGAPLPNAGPLADPMEWLQSVLREAMEGVMAGEDPPLQKANAVARLAALFLKARQVKELEQTNKELIRRLAELEQRLAEAATQDGSPIPPATAAPSPEVACSRTGSAPPPPWAPRSGRGWAEPGRRNRPPAPTPAGGGRGP